MSNMPHRSLEQERADDAWKQVEKIDGTPYRNEYAQLVRSFAIMIHGNGLGPALDYLRHQAEQGNRAHDQLQNHLSTWVLAFLRRTNDNILETDLLTYICQQNSVAFRVAQVETLNYVNWLKRFAEAKGWGDA